MADVSNEKAGANAESADVNHANATATSAEKPTSDPSTTNKSAPHTSGSVRAKAAEKASAVHEKTAAAKQQVTQKKEESKGPSGGFDDTPVPKRAPGYTIKITFHRASNLPIADLNSLSSDPYVFAEIKHDLPTRHKQDPPLVLRTPTIRRQTEPEWNCDWILCNVPARGFELKARLYDEDPADHDDRLGNVHVHVNNISDAWPGIREQSYPLKKKMGSKRAYLLQAITSCVNKEKPMTGELVLSVQVLGRTQEVGGGKIYTLGPCAWTQHFSPMIGRMVGIKDPTKSKDGQKEQEQYNFQANQMQLRGPVPDKLYHRYVEFRPFVAGMFNAKTIKGRLLNRALHHQHARIYNFDRTTVYGSFPEPCKAMTKQFLDLVHYDEGARIFTYVLMLDGQWRFTETGAEFSVDLLSKHTMHSDVSIYIAFSGEFFIRRLPNNASTDPAEGGSAESDTITTETSKHRHSIEQYQLIIDNDSGTYRPNQDALPLLKEFLERNLPGLHVMTLSCVDDEKKMNKMKEEQRERKKKEGPNIALAQASDDSSISSSDIEDLDAAAGDPKQRGHLGKAMHKVAEPQDAVRHWAEKGRGGKVPQTGGTHEPANEENANGQAAESKGANGPQQPTPGKKEGNTEVGSAGQIDLQASNDIAEKGDKDLQQQKMEQEVQPKA